MRYSEKSSEIIPTGLNFFGEICQSGFMENLEREAQEIYDRTMAEIRKAIKESPLSEDEIADRCGKTQPWVNRIKTGERGEDLPFKTILCLALVLEIDLTTLYLSASPAQSKLKTLLSEISKMIVNE